MNTVDVAQIENDLERLREALAQMTQEKTRIDTAIVQQRGAINYAELLLERAEAAAGTTSAVSTASEAGSGEKKQAEEPGADEQSPAG